jgi:hypothetical protein
MRSLRPRRWSATTKEFMTLRFANVRPHIYSCCPLSTAGPPACRPGCMVRVGTCLQMQQHDTGCTQFAQLHTKIQGVATKGLQMCRENWQAWLGGAQCKAAEAWQRCLDYENPGAMAADGWIQAGNASCALSRMVNGQGTPRSLTGLKAAVQSKVSRGHISTLFCAIRRTRRL